MTRGAVALIGVVVAAAAAGLFLQGSVDDAVAGTTMPEDIDIAAGKALYAEHCAACHGADLEGAENWQVAGADGRLPAPPHDETGHTWHHSDRVLFDYTRLGGRELLAARGIEFDSGMPGFANQLSDQEIWNVLGFIKSTWPERVREMQEQQTAADQGG